MNGIQELFQKDLKVINVGLERFSDALIEQDVSVTQVDWRPPAGGNKRLIEILEILNQ